MELNFFEILKVIFLGIVEGITEWLPISSTGHMLLVDEFLPLQMTEAFKEMFFVVIQLGAILAVVVVFWDKLWPFRFREKPVIQKDIFTMWFKVADSREAYKAVEDFYDKGDVAPLGRLNFVYRGE